MNKALKVVTIGGGTGSSVLLRGLKKYVKNISAIVTVADDGGSSGILRQDLGMLPPGDIRACLIALANTEPEMEQLMNYRFHDGTLEGQSFGNLLIAAMTDIHGGFEEGLRQAEKVLAITGRIYPMTLDDVILYAELEDGSVIEGESNITFLTRKSGGRIKRVFLKPDLSLPLPEAVTAIEEADIILIGPGSLYTSIMPNLLIKDLRDALIRAQGRKIYICNVMTQAGETDRFDVMDHVKAIEKHCGDRVIDTVCVNSGEIPAEDRLRYFYKNNVEPIVLGTDDRKDLEARGIQAIEGDFVDIKHDYIRHNSDALVKAILDRFA